LALRADLLIPVMIVTPLIPVMIVTPLMQLKEATSEEERKWMKNLNCIRKILQTDTTLKGRIMI
jgi:hypothetical protein